MKTSDLDYCLNDSLIADRPADIRDMSKLLVLSRESGRLQDRQFNDLPKFLSKGDMLVLNNTKVLPCRIAGIKDNGRELDILLVRNIGGFRWEILSRGAYTGGLRISCNLSAYVYDGKTAELSYTGDIEEILNECGSMPIPPYIKRTPDEHDKSRYQTVYAREAGSIAAPTAGLHFTEGLLSDIEAMGVSVRYVTLHVGTGTFNPIRTELINQHNMHHEQFEMQSSLIGEIKSCAGRVFAVGTTVARALESAVSGRFAPLKSANGTIAGATDIFIYPGCELNAVDCLITNFHLPRSTPLFMAAALAGAEDILKAYEHAINGGYRFYSYGDSMLII